MYHWTPFCDKNSGFTYVPDGVGIDFGEFLIRVTRAATQTQIKKKSGHVLI